MKSALLPGVLMALLGGVVIGLGQWSLHYDKVMGANIGAGLTIMSGELLVGVGILIAVIRAILELLRQRKSRASN